MSNHILPLRIMVVDDEDSIRVTLVEFLKNLGHSADAYSNAADAIAAMHADQPDLVVLDICLPEVDGLSLMQDLMVRFPGIAVILITGFGTMDTVIKALRFGASDFLHKPIKLEELEAAVEKTRRLIAYEDEKQRLRGALRVIQKHNHPEQFLENLVGESECIHALKKQIAMVAAGPCQNILITGETGTGKEVVANLLHNLRHGPTAPFIPVNCPAIPEPLVESELFGHKKGAFTGASEDRIGAFCLADGGTLFLDELSDLSAAAQAKLLRGLETRSIRPVGSVKEIEVKTTVIAASNQNLEKRIQEGLFRADLFYRLNAFVIELKPLRERNNDILPLARHFLEISHVSSTMKFEISHDAIQALLSYHYPGNVRELKNIIERAAMLSPNGKITPAALSIRLSNDFHSSSPDSASQNKTGIPSVITEAQREAEITLEALQKANWNRKKAAADLGISYAAIRWRMEKYQLTQITDICCNHSNP